LLGKQARKRDSRISTLQLGKLLDLRQNPFRFRAGANRSNLVDRGESCSIRESRQPVQKRIRRLVGLKA
jgi:hypothetical protein